MKKRMFLMLLSLVLALGLAACGNQETSNTGSESTDGEPGDYIDDVTEHMDPEAISGSYEDSVSQRAMMEIVFSEEDEVYSVTINWSSSASESTRWTMHAKDEGESALNFTDGLCENLVYDEDGNESVETVYENKEGSLIISDNNAIIWLDDEGEEHIFEKAGEVSVENPMKEYASLEELNEAVGTFLCRPGVMGVSNEDFVSINTGDYLIAQYDFDLNGNHFYIRASKDERDISGYYLADGVGTGTAFEGKAAPKTIDYVSDDYGMLARWFTGGQQFVFVALDYNNTETAFKGIAEEMKATMTP